MGQQGTCSTTAASYLAQCLTNHLQSSLTTKTIFTLISTFNVRTLNILNQLLELIFSPIELNIAIICVQALPL